MLRSIASIIKKETGSVGILSIITMILLGVVGAAYISLSTSELNSSASYRNGVAAQFLAEAGARRAIVELDKNNGWTKMQKSEEMGNGVTKGTYYVEVTGSSGQNRTITSTGVVGNATRKIVLKLTLSSSPVNTYSYSIFSGSNMTVDNNANVNGSVRSNLLININNNANVSQDVLAHSGINVGNNASIGGTKTPDAPTITIPTYKSSDYSGGQTINSVGNNSTVTLNGANYYRNGDLVISNNSTVTGNCTIYVTGNVILENNVTLTGNIMIIAEKDINVGNGATVNKGILYSAQNINLDNNSSVTGSAVANGVVNVHNNATITYNQSIVQNFGLGGTTQLTINSWGNQE